MTRSSSVSAEFSSVTVSRTFCRALKHLQPGRGRDDHVGSAVAAVRFAGDEIRLLQLVDEGDNLAGVESEKLGDLAL